MSLPGGYSVKIFLVYKILFLPILISGRVDNRPPNSPSLYFSYSPDPDSVADLQRMFPDIPQRFIIRELDRANGVVSNAVDALVLLNPDFSGSTSPTLSNDNLCSKDTVTHQAIIEEINSTAQELPLPTDEPKIDRKDWESTDAKARQRVLAERKRAMLLKARDAFRKSNEIGQ